jgi:uncharacterized membrane protein
MKPKKYALLCLVIALAVAMASFSLTQATDNISFTSSNSGTINKDKGDSFTVKLNVKNTGEDKGEFSISVTFEAEAWTWKGTQKTVTLNAGETKQLTWEGKVPNNAASGSVARLIVYYGDSYKALDWWICVSSNSELSIISSHVY